MKKKNINTKLRLSKKTVSKFNSSEVKGGLFTFVNCGPLDTRVSICFICNTIQGDFTCDLSDLRNCNSERC